MKKYNIILNLLLLAGSAVQGFAQAPGGVSAGLTAWFKPDAGITFSTGTVVSQWANQATNTNLADLSAVGGATSQVTNEPYPFNFNTFLQYNAGAFVKGSSTVYTEIIGATAGSMFGIGTAPDQLLSVSSNTTTAPMGANRGNTGFRFNRSEFSNGNCMFSANAVANTGNANLYGLRAATTASPAHENTYNGHRNTGAANARTNVSWRFAIGSFPGYYYGNNKSGEAICYDRQLDPGEFQKVESYLAIKYGITLGNNANPGSYTSSASGILWQGDPVYQNRVTVIGRDDASGLKQLQSRSVAPGSKVMLFKGNTGGNFPLMNAANTSNFTTDFSFVALGDNNKDTALALCAYGNKVVKMKRVWKVAPTNYSGDVTIAIDAIDFSPNVNAIMYSANENFTTASSTVIPLITSGTRKYAVIPANAGYFTLTTKPVSIDFEIEDLFCKQTSGGRITAHVTGGLAPLSYSWDNNTGSTDSTITGLTAGLYTLTLTHGPGCVVYDQATVDVKTIDIEADYDLLHLICYGEQNGTMTIQPKNGRAPYQYKIASLSDWQSSNHFSGLSAGTYYVDIEDANGCTGRDTVIIDEPSPVFWRASVTNDYCDMGKANGAINFVFLQGGSPPYTYLLNNLTIELNNNTIAGLREGSYLFEVIDANGCRFHERFEIEQVPCCVVKVPSAFTPNEDGKNDLFTPVYLGEVKLVKFQVYNRWGQEVYNTFQWGKGWDGKFNNQPAEIGTYFYSIKYSCETSEGSIVETQKGDVTLFR